MTRAKNREELDRRAARDSYVPVLPARMAAVGGPSKPHRR